MREVMPYTFPRNNSIFFFKKKWFSPCQQRHATLRQRLTERVCSFPMIHGHSKKSDPRHRDEPSCPQGGFLLVEKTGIYLWREDAHEPGNGKGGGRETHVKLSK